MRIFRKYCEDHKQDGMIDIHAKYFTCQHKDCDAVPTFKMLEHKRATQCGQHSRNLEGQWINKF